MDTLVYEIRNISSSSISNINLTLRLPSGVYYKSGSFKGIGVSESNISNLNAPVFKFSNFTLAGYLRFAIVVSSTCDLQTYISKGNQATTQLDFTYAGRNESHTTGSINVNIPNILINAITNQIKNAYLNDKFVRESTIRNTGKGGASSIFFFRTNGNGLKVISSRIADKYNVDSIISKLDSTDFKLVGNKDKYLDANEEVKIYDTVTVIKCSNLTSIYTVNFGCSKTVCNSSSKNAIVNFDPFIQGLTITPKSTIDWCFDINKPSSNEIIVINKSNKHISNTIVTILQSYGGGFYNYQMSAIDTTGMTVTKGKYGPALTKNFANFRYNFVGSYFTCLGSSPIGGFSLSFGSMKVNDTLYVRWKSISCMPNVCNTTITAHRWTYSATYTDTCATVYTVNEAWGSTGGIQYMGAIPWIPTDIVANTPDKLNYTITSASLFPSGNKARFAIKLILESGIKHSLKANDIKFTDVAGTDWKPYLVKVNSAEIWAYFYNPTIALAKSELNIVIEADCKASNPSGLKNYSVTFLYSPDTTCNVGSDFQLYCVTGKIKVHCTKTCSSGGMLFKSFNVYRKNFGKPDNNNDGLADGSGTVDLTKIKLNRSFVYDTLSSFYSGIVTPSGTTTMFFNGRIKTSVLNGSLLKPLPAGITIYRNGKSRYACNKLPVSSYVSGTTRFCEVDLNLNAATAAGCGTISNYFFYQGDSVVINLKYVYITNIGPYSGEAFFDNPEFYLSTMPNPNASQKLQCDTFSGRHILLGSYFTNYATENYTSSSCSPVTLYNSYYFSAGSCCDNYAGGNPFPYEYRHFNYLDKMKVTIPKGYTFSSAAIYYYGSNGTSKYTTNYCSNLKPKIDVDTLIFNMDTLFNATKGIFKRSDEGYQGTFVLNLLPGCKTAINTYETVKYTTTFKWPESGAVDVVENYPDNLQFNHPSILLTAMNSLSASKKDTFSWDVIVSNTKSGSSIGNVWIANSMPQKVKVLAVKDLSTGAYLAVKNGVFKAGTLNSTTARSFRILATSTTCKTDSFKLAIGWNCNSYPDSLEAYSCKNLLTYINLILSPKPPLIISTLLEDTARTDVCTNRKYKAIIANVDEDNIYNLKLRVTIPTGTTFVDTGMYYSFPYGSKFGKLSKPILISGTTYEWALSDSVKVLKNGLEKVSDTAKSKVLIQFFLETNCQITAGAFVSIMPDGKIGCGEPVRKIGYTGKPIKIIGVDNPYYSLIKFSPDSVNLCNPSVAFKTKIIYLGPTKTLNSDSVILTLPIGFEPDTASLTTVRINGRGVVKDVNGEKRWYWAIPKGLLPGDSSMLDFKIKLTNKAPACGLEPISMLAVTKKKAYCVKLKDSCDINVATGSYYKAIKLDRAEPVIKLIRSVSVNAGDSGEIVDIAFAVTNTKKAIDTSLATKFYLIIDQNKNNKYDNSDIIVKSFIKTKGWLSNQIVNFSFSGFVKNNSICKLLIISDSTNCQCLKNSLPILNVQLKNAGRDSTFCSNYPASIGLDSIKGYKYEWLPSDYLSAPYRSRANFKKPNLSSAEQNFKYILKTSRMGGCFSYDTVILKSKSFITLPKLKDTTVICSGGMAQIGDTAKGGFGTLSFNWLPATGLSSSTQMVVKANPKNTTKYFITVKDQNNCSVKDSLILYVSKLPSVKIGHSGFCEKKDVQFFDQSNYFGSQKGNVIWRINFNNVTQVDPVFVFDTIGYYFVRLVASNQYGCTDSTFKYVKISGIPNPFNTKLNQCQGDSVKLTDASTVAKMGIKKIIWRFASDSLQGKTIAKKFSTPGKHYFTQIVTSDSGCINQRFDSIDIFDKPKADFKITGKCLNDSVSFINLSKPITGDSIISYKWAINDSVYYSKNTKILFDTIGVYRAVMTIQSSKGCGDSIVKPFQINARPIANFSLVNYCPYDTISLNSLSSIAKGKLKSYTWKIDDVFVSGKANTKLNPLTQGLYNVTLVTQSDSGCTDSLQKTFKVYPGIIIKSLFSKTCENDTMKFSDLSVQGNAKVFSRLLSNMSGFFTDSIAFFPVNSKGIYNYRFIISTTNGCTFVKDSIYEVLEKPKADFISNSPCNDNFVIFTDKSSPGANTSLVSTQWYENNILINSIPTFSTRFLSSGSKSIHLKVQNGLGCIDTITIPTLVAKANYANISFNNACPFDTVRAIFTGFTGSNLITQYSIKWGDGNMSTTLPAKYVYSQQGTYVVQLSITTLSGCTYDTTRTVKIFPVPKADFSYYPQYPDIKNPTVSFTDKASGAAKWVYKFGDGFNSVLQNPVYAFKDSGRYAITQVVENNDGCKDSITQVLYVNFLLFTHIPNAFSPGLDPINPLFQPSGLGIKDYQMIIYNRWGEKLFEPGWGKHAWDGTYKNEFVQIGFYPYYMEIVDFGNKRHSYSGVVNVIR